MRSPDLSGRLLSEVAALCERIGVSNFQHITNHKLL